VVFVRLGLENRLVIDPAIWHCYNCNECSTRCPSRAKPSRIMGALRHLATERFAYPRTLARIVNSPRLSWLVFAAAAGLLAAMVAATGAFTPGPGPLRYDGMLPDAALNLFFFGFTAIALVAVTVGATRAWSGWYGSSLRAARPRAMGGALKQAAVEILAHRKFSECEEQPLRVWAHRGIVYGFLGLLALSGVVAVLLLFGAPYPLSIVNPLKVLGNVFAAMLLGGASYFLVRRALDSTRGQTSPFFDWAFLVNVLLVGLTGVGAEVFRVADVRALAYPDYFIHLVLVFVLIVMLPYTKLAHAVYRLLAVAGRKYGAIVAEEDSPERLAQGNGHVKRLQKLKGIPTPPEAEASVATPETFIGLGHEELASYSDATLTAAYYKLRDEAEPRGEGTYYPNIKRLFGTAFEREKDRREARALVNQPDKPEVQVWYEHAAEQPCTWWVENHLIARHALTSCQSCGMCTSVCPAAEHYEGYDPRDIVDVALSGDEDRLVALLKSDLLWYCAQCGSCTGRCPRENDVMGLVSSLRCLAQLKGYHVQSVRGRQQYAGRHLWGENLWNRACSLYFRNPDADSHPDFGPRYARYFAEQEEQHERLGGDPDMDGVCAGRKVPSPTLKELRACIRAGGALLLWDRIEEHGAAQAEKLGLDLDEYYEKVRREG
jgi:quinone-modifying oxidoreductase subunit QmoC